MKKLLILLISLFLLGCSNKYDGCSAEPNFLIEGEVQRVEYMGEGGLFGNINTVIYFTDGRTVVLRVRENILYKNIIIYRTCIIAGSYIIKEKR